MKRPKQLVLLRHAESARNAAKKSVFFADEYARRHVKGIPDYEIPITEKGQQQARKTGEYLAEHFGTFDYIYNSGYRRTVETLEHVLQAYSKQQRAAMTVRQDIFVRERDPGYGYDMTEAEAEEYFPWLQEYWQAYGGFFASPPGGESIAKMSERVFQFLGMLFTDHPGEKILVVTHAGTIRAFRFLLEHWNHQQALAWPKGQEPVNCGITVYNYNDTKKGLELSDYNIAA